MTDAHDIDLSFILTSCGRSIPIGMNGSLDYACLIDAFLSEAAADLAGRGHLRGTKSLASFDVLAEADLWDLGRLSLGRFLPAASFRSGHPMAHNPIPSPLAHRMATAALAALARQLKQPEKRPGSLQVWKQR